MKQKKKLTSRQLSKYSGFKAGANKKAASAVNLVYITSSTAGIQRVKKGKSYSYIYKGKKVKDAATLERIKKLAIPPSWTDAWICASPNGHIQATGIDMLGRKQYRYHTNWNELRSETKFHRLYEFGKVLPQLRRLAKKDIAGKELSDKKVIATVINLMEETYIRIGNNDYEKKYGSYGLTTLKDRHVSISKDHIHFCFTGKKGIEHTITVKNKRLARLVKQCRDIPGKELFQYYTAEGERRSIDSGMVNSYLRKASGGMEVSAKDFRTWAGSLKAIECLTKAGETETKKDTQQTIVSMLDEVSEKLGNTRTICKKYYVHPGIIKLYEEGKLVSLVNDAMARKPLRGLNKEETALMTALKKCC